MAPVKLRKLLILKDFARQGAITGDKMDEIPLVSVGFVEAGISRSGPVN